jgi:hypothetical protein
VTKVAKSVAGLGYVKLPEIGECVRISEILPLRAYLLDHVHAPCPATTF